MRAKRLSRALLPACDTTQEELAEHLGKARSYVERRLSRSEQWEDHFFNLRDVLAFPDEAKRLVRDALDEDLGEESRPIADPGDRALLKSIVRGLSDAAFVLRAADEDGLLEAEEAEEVREAATELMTLLGALAHRCGAKAKR